MIANYHTHTWRCRHADGTEREYVETAIEAGFKILGFSDHTPQVYPGGYVCPVKMLPEELEGYVDTVLDLKREYKSDIEIHLGLEVEYLYTLWEPLMRLIEPYPIEYLILGQHYLGNGMYAPFRFCKEIDMPLEINLLGVREDRNYPRELFWKIAAREGNSVIYGMDAHHAAHMDSPEVIAKADRFLERCGIPRERLIDVMEIG